MASSTPHAVGVATPLLLVAVLAFSCGGSHAAWRGTTIGFARSDDPWLAGAGAPCDPATRRGPAPPFDVLAAGTGEPVEPGMTVRVHYVARLPSGKTVHDTHEDNMPSEIILGSTRVLCGFERSLVGMRAGEQRRVVIPASLGFRAEKRPLAISTNSPLVFVIELYLPEAGARTGGGGSAPPNPYEPRPSVPFVGTRSPAQGEAEYGKVPPP